MQYTLKRISVIKTSLFAAVLYAVLSIVIVLPMTLIMMATGAASEGDAGAGMLVGGVFMLILFPIMYAIMGFLTTAIAVLIYNAVAKMMGGIEFTLEADNSLTPIASTNRAVDTL